MIKNILEFLEESASSFPDKTAIICREEKITYSHLLIKSKSIGTYLASKLSARTPIGIYADKSIDMLSAFFGCVYAGCFYSTLNTELPAQRLKNVADILAAPVILTDNDNFEKAQGIFEGREIVTFSQMLNQEPNKELLGKIRAAHTDTMPLYINFTSGSSGVPKGVTVGHGNVISFINSFCKTFEFDSSLIFANQAPLDFDVSVKDIYSSIKLGATLVLIPREYFMQPQALVDYIDTNKCTTLIWAVSALTLLVTFHALDYKTPKSIKHIFFSGEVMPVKQLRKIIEKLPEATYCNLYGPTEITCNCSYYVIDTSYEYEKYPIGKAFDNTKILLLDENNQLITEPNIEGEICVCGAGVSLGYYNAPEQTAKAFVQNPLNHYYREIMYKTGDKAKYDNEGNLVFMGRLDFQIKYLGHRIELEEVEGAVLSIDGVDSCCCIFIEEKHKLVMFYSGNIEKRELLLRLHESLPRFMVPTTVKKKDFLPLNKNGKTDRKALREEL